MYKKISALIITIALSTALTLNTYAYSNMYQTDSNIPNFSEVTGATLTNKEYALGSTIYYYTIPICTEAFGDYNKVNWFYEYIYMLSKNGYQIYDSAFFTDDTNMINVYLYNPNKGLYIDMFYMEYGFAISIHK